MPAYDGRFERQIKIFVDAMRYKLMVNAHRGRWEGLDLDKALQLLIGEVEELRQAIAGGNVTEISLESADIGNYALMIQDIAIRGALDAIERDWAAPNAAGDGARSAGAGTCLISGVALGQRANPGGLRAPGVVDPPRDRPHPNVQAQDDRRRTVPRYPDEPRRQLTDIPTDSPEAVTAAHILKTGGP